MKPSYASNDLLADARFWSSTGAAQQPTTLGTEDAAMIDKGTRSVASETFDDLREGRIVDDVTATTAHDLEQSS